MSGKIIVGSADEDNVLVYKDDEEQEEYCRDSDDDRDEADLLNIALAHYLINEESEFV